MTEALALTPATLFALKMGVCLALFLLGAARLRRMVDRVKRARGLPPRDSSVLQAFAHYFKGNDHARSPDGHERRLYRQTIRILARELQRLDANNEDAREAIDLLTREAGEPAATRCAMHDPTSATSHPPGLP
ncbi:MAG: hypothetical protein ACREH6_10330, partial [Geminicoccaceae bacterium]